MQIIQGTTAFEIEGKSAVAIGKFDGIHEGHRLLLSHILKERENGRRSVVFTFDPPASVFFGKSGEGQLTTRREKRQIFAELGIDVLVEFPLTAETAAISPEKFIEEILCGQLHAAYVAAGTDLSFGYRGQGNQELLQKMADTFGICNDITAAELGRFQDVFTMEEVDSDEKELWGLLEQVLRKACEQFVETRKTEGENLRTDLLQKLDQMFEKVGMVEERSPQILQEYRQKLEDKMKELLSDTQIEESRIASEVIIYADKICTDEETVRLKSHIRHMKEVLADGEGIGRKLDFIAQEMNREANTILSKANDLETSNLAIDLKTEIEKVREQIQNIE